MDLYTLLRLWRGQNTDLCGQRAWGKKHGEKETSSENHWCLFLQNKKLQLEISNGIIQGKKQATEKKHMTYYSFQGIPYAQPPVQNLRFRVSLFFKKKVYSLAVCACHAKSLHPNHSLDELLRPCSSYTQLPLGPSSTHFLWVDLHPWNQSRRPTFTLPPYWNLMIRWPSELGSLD